MLVFDWDDRKSERNARRRGLPFETAARIFLGRTLEAVDGRVDYGEVRVKAIGAVDQVVLAVIYTDRDDVRRIVSARVASRRERRLWQE